jgi:Flp pilus assembly protein TadB
MSSTFAYNLFFAMLFGVGVWMLVSGLTGFFHQNETAERMDSFLGRKGARQLVVTAVPSMPLAQRVLSPMLMDVGFFLFQKQDHESVEDRLRRTGWPYTSLGDYYGSKVALAVAYFGAGVFCGVLMQLSPLWIAVLAAGLGLLGLFRPDGQVNTILKERRESIFREMAWTVERIAAVMKTGEALEPALNRLTNEDYSWVAGGSGGLFIALLRDIAAGLSTRRSDVEDMLNDLRRNLPDNMPELEEFLQVVQINIQKRQPVVEQLRTLGRTMRDQLNNRIDEVAQKAELKVVAITSGVIVPSMLFVVGGAAILGFLKIF